MIAASRWRVSIPALLLAAISGCSAPSSASSRAAEVKPAALRAVAVQPLRRDVPVTIEQPGQIEAYEQTPVFAKIGGYVAEVCVDMDARVKQGDCLAKLAVPEMEDELRHQQAAVAQAGAEQEQVRRTLQTAEASIRATTAQLAEAQSGLRRAEARQELAASELGRIERLVERQVIDQQTRDEARHLAKSSAAALEEATAKVRTAEAARDESVARRDKVLADIEVARTKLEVARHQEQRLRTLLQYAVLQAPFDGVVTRRNVHTGHLLRPGETSNREPLFVVARLDPVRIFVDVPEGEAQLVRPGVPARVRIQALRDREIDTKVARTSWALDPGNRTLRAEIELPNPTGELRPGMYAYAALLLNHAGTWTVPAAAVQRSEDVACCFLLHDGKAVRTPLRLGARDGQLVEVLRKRVGADSRWHELSGDETVLQPAGGALADGARVELTAGKE